ncbi:MAG TPA: methyltransferase domain-containing protein [Ktedonobacteraceae bacterium]|nr:methyltransferase domain-containing protein [Ktedonobacteraceae bacterium]
MAMENPVHLNECGLPLNAIEWLETHHRSKLAEREQMIQDLQLGCDSRIVDAGCGPGLWTPLLARAIGSGGSILGVDVSAEALVTARQRGIGQWYEKQVCYKQSSMEHLPVANGSIHTIFSANVSQYLPEPVRTFAALGRYLAPGGRLVVKDIDFGTIRFYNVDPALQARVFCARQRWEEQRLREDYLFEDSWVGSKLADYFRAAGYKDIQEKCYRVVRHAPLAEDFRSYVQGIASWFVCEDAPFLIRADSARWLTSFGNGDDSLLDQATFGYEETEFMVTGVWSGNPLRNYFDMHINVHRSVLDPEYAGY